MKTMPAIIAIATVVVLALANAISFRNGIVDIQNRKQGENESMRVSYSQCVTKITETNGVAKAYKNDLVEVTKAAGDNLQAFDQQMMTWLTTNLLPEVSPNLRENVQREIVSCRNAFVNRIDQSVKPLYVEYNNRVEKFPGLLWASMFGYSREDLKLPKTEAVQKAFDTGTDEPLELE